MRTSGPALGEADLTFCDIRVRSVIFLPKGQWSSRTMSSLELRLLLVALALAARLDARAMQGELDEGLGREGRKVGALDNCAGGRAGEV